MKLCPHITTYNSFLFNCQKCIDWNELVINGCLVKYGVVFTGIEWNVFCVMKSLQSSNLVQYLLRKQKNVIEAYLLYSIWNVTVNSTAEELCTGVENYTLFNTLDPRNDNHLVWWISKWLCRLQCYYHCIWRFSHGFIQSGTMRSSSFLIVSETTKTTWSMEQIRSAGL